MSKGSNTDQIRNRNTRYNFEYQFVPNEILATPQLTPTQKMVFIGLLSYNLKRTGKIFPGLNNLAFRIGVNRRTVIRALKDLEEKSLIHIRRRGKTKTNLYTILPSPKWLKKEMDQASEE